jgi:hypothetical protein
MVVVVTPKPEKVLCEPSIKVSRGEGFGQNHRNDHVLKCQRNSSLCINRLADLQLQGLIPIVIGMDFLLNLWGA